jgi:AcrR family transcriptional regulator
MGNGETPETLEFPPPRCYLELVSTDMTRVKTESKRIEILEAASRVFDGRDHHHVLIDAVAADAGVGKGTIYRYFETKEDLYFATILHGVDEIAAALSESVATISDPRARLERIARELIEYFWTRGDLSRLLMEDVRRFDSRQEELDKRKAIVQRLVEQCICDGIASRDFRVTSVPLAAAFFRGMIRAALEFRRVDDTPDKLVAAILEIFSGGVGRKPA